MTEPDAATRSVVVERVVPHPPEKVWRALTEGPLMEQWLMANDFRPVVGHRFRLRTTPMPQWNGVVDSEVLVVEPHERLAYRWDASVGGPENTLKTVVTWTLTPAEGGVLVRMEQSGFRADQEANYRGAGHGWRRFLEGLERVVATLD